jgi:hypothetical protein
MARAQRAGVVIAAGLLVAAVTAAAAAAAQPTANPGWRLVSSRHPGPAGDIDVLISTVATSRNGAWAFGAEVSVSGRGVPLAERWNGRTWQAAALLPGLTGELGPASAPAANDVWVVATVGGYVLHYNGSRWSVAKRWRPRQVLTGVTALSPTNVWVFGGLGAGTWHLHGTTWTKVTGIAGTIDTASAVSPRNIWAVAGPSFVVTFGRTGASARARAASGPPPPPTVPPSTIVHYDGSTWKKVTSRALNGLEATDILAASPGNAWTAGITGGGAPVLVHLKGSTWTRVRLRWPVVPVRLAPDGSGGLWMIGVGAGGWLALHLSRAGTWQRYALPGAAFALGLAHVPRTAAMWAAGTVLARVNAAIWAYGPIG